MLRQVVCVSLVLLACGAITYSQVTTGTISGTVKDSTGAVLPGATVVVQNQETGVSRTLTTDAGGRYSAPDLGLAGYQITASLSGFESETRSGIVLTIGRQAVVDFQLNVGAVSQTVQVTGEAPLVQTTEATMSNLTNDTQIRELPLNGRDLSQLILLSPNVTQSDSKSTYAYNGFGRRISIAGMQGEDNAYLLDGGYVDDFYHHIPAGPTGELLGVETVQEFTVLTSSYSAQYGDALGGVFNAVSRSGTNEFHGDVFEFIRNSDMDARSFFDPGSGPPPFRRNQFGATVGGPIQKDKTFFFASYETLRQTLGTTTTAVVPTAAAWTGNAGTAGTVTVAPVVRQYQSLFPLPNSTIFTNGTGNYVYDDVSPTSFNFGQARVDHQFSDKDSFFLRYTGSNATEISYAPLPEFSDTGELGTDYATLSETHIFSPAMLANTKFQFDRVVPVDVGGYPPVPVGAFAYPGQAPPALDISGLTSLEGVTHYTDNYTTNRFEPQEDFSYVKGSHSMTFGGMFQRIQFNMDAPDRPFGEWTFPTLTAFLEGDPSQYRGTPPGIGNPIRGYRQDLMGVYFQDDWKVKPNLTLNLGIRYEPYTVPTEENGLIANLRNLTDPTSTIGSPLWENRSWNNWAPRFGIAWSPFGSGKTSVRAGFGEFFIPFGTEALQDVGTRVPPQYPFYQVPSTTYNLASAFPSGLPIVGSIGTAFTSGDVIPYQRQNSQHALEYNFSIQQQLGANDVVTLGYVGNRGIDILSYLSENTPVPIFDGVSLAVPPGSSQATLPNPAFNNVSYWADAANSWYNAFTARLERRLAAGLTGSVSYTWSKAETESDGGKVAGSDLESGSVVPDAFDLAAFKYLSGYNVPQVFTTSADYQLPFGKGMANLTGHLISGWELSGILTAESGLPATITATAPASLSGLNIATRTPNWAGCSTFVTGNPNQWFNPACFSFPTATELGNVDQNFVPGPGLFALNLSLDRNFTLTERFKLQFRAESFNLTNHANFALPSGTTVFNGSGVLQGSAGQITSVVSSAPGRQLQFALKLIF